MASVATGDISAAMVTAPVSAADWLIVAPVVVPILAGALLLMFRKSVGLQAVFANGVLALLVVLTGGLLAHVATSGPRTMTMGQWLPPFGIAFSADLTGAILAFTASLVALMCGLYSVADIDLTRRRYGFFPFAMLMMAGVNGAFLTGDIFNMYVWFEVLLISSFGLIVLGSERPQLDGAIKYAFLNLIATTMFLIATGYLYGAFGTLNMADIARGAASRPQGAPVMTIASLYLFAFAMKAAAFPLNFWLPASYHTPRIVVSALFAGLLTKVGVYALLRVMVMMFPDGRAPLGPVIAWVAALTMIVGALGALAQSDLRRLLGFLVVSGIGSMLAGIALGGELAVGGAIVYAVHSMVVMAALYLAAGIVGRRAGTFDLNALGGLYSASPWFAACFLVLAFAVSGLPPFSGFWPKLMLVRASLADGNGWLAGAILATGLLTTIAIVRVFLFAFWRGGSGEKREGAAAPDGSAGRWVAASFAALVAGAVMIGLAPEPLARAGLEAAAGLVSPSAYVDSVFPGGR